MKNGMVCLALLLCSGLAANSQSLVRIAMTGGATFTPVITYHNATGHINTALTGSLAFQYRPIPSLGAELKLSVLSRPTSYLNSDTGDNTVKIYTTSPIVFQRILAAFNYYLPLKKVQPFAGFVTGASYVQTTKTAPQSHIINFNYGVQAGVVVNLGGTFAVQWDGCLVFIPNVSNNSSFFDVAADGSGFPSFVLGDPSRATIKQYNVNFGVVYTLSKKEK